MCEDLKKVWSEEERAGTNQKNIHKMNEGDQTKMKLWKRSETRSSRALLALKKVQPEIQVNERELQQLWEALRQMECAGLLDVP